MQPKKASTTKDLRLILVHLVWEESFISRKNGRIIFGKLRLSDQEVKAATKLQAILKLGGTNLCNSGKTVVGK